VIAYPSSYRPTPILMISGTTGLVTDHFEDKAIVACCRSEVPTAPTRVSNRPWGKHATMDMDRVFNDQNLGDFAALRPSPRRRRSEKYCLVCWLRKDSSLSSYQ
jgi:hypothetical protein